MSRPVASPILTRAILEEILEEQEEMAGDLHQVQVISAFETPCIYYDPVKRQFFNRSEPRKLHSEVRRDGIPLILIIHLHWHNDFSEFA